MKSKETVYDFAVGLMDGEKQQGRNLLRPEKAIFSTVMNIVSNKSEPEQERILGKNAFNLLKTSLLELADGNINLFMSLVGDSINGAAREWEYIKVPLSAFPGETREINVPKYTEEEKTKILQKALGDNNSKIRLAVGRVVKEYFPVTENFKTKHYKVMDEKLGVKGWIDRVSRLGKSQLN